MAPGTRLQRAGASAHPPAPIPAPVARVNGGAGRPSQAVEQAEGGGQDPQISPLVG